MPIDGSKVQQMSKAPSEIQRAPITPESRESEPRREQVLTVERAPAAASRTAQDRTGAPAPAKHRDAYFDNVKYLAIVLVAVAHAWEPVMDGSRVTRALYMFVYTFHMPAFILVSGYFSRSFDMSSAKVKRLVTGVVVPYVLFETAYSLFKRYAGGVDDAPISLLDPLFLTWFLIALFIWRVTTPIWQSLRHPLPVALVIAMLASVSPEIGDDLDLQRVCQLLPFFVLGLLMKPEHFQLIRRREVRLLAVPLAAGALAFAYWAAPHAAGLVLPQQQRAGDGLPVVDGARDDPGHVRMRAAAHVRVPRLGPPPPHVVHRAGCRDHLRLPAARLPDQGR